MGKDLRCVSVLAALLGLLVTNLSTTADAGSPMQGKSPVKGRAALSVPSLFEGRVKPVPELIMRDEISTFDLPYAENQLDTIEAMASGYRDSKEKTLSGIWKLVYFYIAYERHARGLAEQDILQEIEFAEKWRSAFPQSPTPIIVGAIFRQALGRLVLQMRKDIEDSGGNNPMQEEYMARFLPLVDTQSYLTAHKKVGARDPMWFAYFIEAGSQKCNALEYTWKSLMEGANEHPGFHQMYFEYLETAAQCVSNIDELQAHISKVAKLGKSLSREPGEAMYTRLQWVVHDRIAGPAAFELPTFDKPRMLAGMRDILSQYNEPWNINNLAKFACEMREQAVMDDLLTKALEHPVLTVWRSHNSFETCWSSRK